MRLHRVNIKACCECMGNVTWVTHGHFRLLGAVSIIL